MRLCIPMLLFVFIGLTSCSFEEGKGGSATITGKVYVEDYNSDGILVAEGYAPNWDVYILYGDETTIGDQSSTSFDGSYEFKNLHTGNYKVYAYSKCNSCPNNIEAITVDVVIESNGETVELGDILVLD